MLDVDSLEVDVSVSIETDKVVVFFSDPVSNNANYVLSFIEFDVKIGVSEFLTVD